MDSLNKSGIAVLVRKTLGSGLMNMWVYEHRNVLARGINLDKPLIRQTLPRILNKFNHGKTEHSGYRLPDSRGKSYYQK